MLIPVNHDGSVASIDHGIAGDEAQMPVRAKALAREFR
jgi:hypothetical protein